MPRTEAPACGNSLNRRLSTRVLTSHLSVSRRDAQISSKFFPPLQAGKTVAIYNPVDGEMILSRPMPQPIRITPHPPKIFLPGRRLLRKIVFTFSRRHGHGGTQNCRRASPHSR